MILTLSGAGSLPPPDPAAAPADPALAALFAAMLAGTPGAEPAGSEDAPGNPADDGEGPEPEPKAAAQVDPLLSLPIQGAPIVAPGVLPVMAAAQPEDGPGAATAAIGAAASCEVRRVRHETAFGAPKVQASPAEENRQDAPILLALAPDQGSQGGLRSPPTPIAQRWTPDQVRGDGRGGSNRAEAPGPPNAGIELAFGFESEQTRPESPGPVMSSATQRLSVSEATRSAEPSPDNPVAGSAPLPPVTVGVPAGANGTPLADAQMVWRSDLASVMAAEPTASDGQASSANRLPPAPEGPMPVEDGAIAGPERAPERLALDTNLEPAVEAVARLADPVRVAEVSSAPATPSAPAAPAASPGPAMAEAAVERRLDLAHDTRWLDQLARDIALTASREGELRFRLNPEHLGSLAVEVRQGAEGATVRLTADTEHARQVIAEAQPRLVAEARAQGLRIADAQVTLSGGQTGPGDGQRQPAHRAEPLPQTAAPRRETAAAVTVNQPIAAIGDRYA